MMYVNVNVMSFNSNCRILAAELNYRFTIICHDTVDTDTIGASLIYIYQINQIITSANPHLLRHRESCDYTLSSFKQRNKN